MGRAGIDVYLVQHGEKETSAGDPALSPLGVKQARLTAEYLRGRHITRVYASPLRRVLGTAQIIADTLSLAVRIDERLRERMNWGESSSPQTRDEFLAEWDRATRERDFTPQSGDSSRAAGRRVASLLDDVVEEHAGGSVALVTHGGVTVDLLRNLFSDDVIERHNPAVDVIADGVPGCAITHLVRHGDAYELRALASVAHLPAYPRTRHLR